MYTVHVHILFNYSIRKISLNQKIKKMVIWYIPAPIIGVNESKIIEIGNVGDFIASSYHCWESKLK